MNKNKALKEFNSKKTTHLILSVVLDVMGMSTYLIPVLGEFGDLLFAPIYALSIFIMYRKNMLTAIVGGGVGFVEELLPATDIVPTALLMWTYTYVLNKEKTINKYIDDTNSEMDMFNKLKN